MHNMDQLIAIFQWEMYQKAAGINSKHVHPASSSWLVDCMATLHYNVGTMRFREDLWPISEEISPKLMELLPHSTSIFNCSLCSHPYACPWVRTMHPYDICVIYMT